MIGRWMSAKILSTKNQQTPKPTAMLIKAPITRRRSSSRCSRKLMGCSSSVLAASNSTAASGIGAFHRHIGLFGLERTRGDRSLRLRRLDGLLALFLVFDLADFFFDLVAELVGGALELGQALPQLAADLRQFPRAKDQ